MGASEVLPLGICMGVGDCAEGKGLEEQEGCQTLYAGEELGKEGRL